MTTRLNPKLEAFLDALPLAGDDQFVSAPGLGTFRAKFIRRGLERGVVAVHWTGAGLTLVQPDTHGACGYCKGRKGSQPCEHCACSLCSWFRQTDERASPRVTCPLVFEQQFAQTPLSSSNWVKITC